MTIAIDARLYGLKHAGIGRYTQNLISQLARIDKHNHYILFVADSSSLVDIPRLHTLVEAPIKHYSLAEQTQFLKILNSVPADIYHFPHFNVPVLFNRPYVVTIHDLLWHEKIGFTATTLPKWLYLFKYLAYRVTIRLAVAKAKHILTPTNYVKNSVHNTFGKSYNQITTTYEAADEIYLSDTISKQSALKKYQVTRPYIIYTGSLYPHKNVEKVVQVLKKFPDLQLIVASARNIFSNKFWKYVVSHGLRDQVKLLGFVPDKDLKSLYTQALALVQPSLSEGFGLTGLEAMASGCLVLCNDHPVLKEIYGRAAVYVDMREVSQVQQALTRIIRDNRMRSKYVQIGKQQSYLYSWRRMAEETLEVYSKVPVADGIDKQNSKFEALNPIQIPNTKL